jgi:2-polyprenyl-3-methyl-5-hydroxy-6-metoxy-1,4-benzoquinol methylase
MSVHATHGIDRHFAFGKNWASYAKLIDDVAIHESKRSLTKLIPKDDYEGRTFLDIGCGSGLHALASAMLGVARIVAVDIDGESVATTRALLERWPLSIPWQAEQISVFDLDPARHGTFDIVYSWGALHHTGDMWGAIKKAAQMVAPGGRIAIALYRNSPFDAFWKREKRFYSHAGPIGQRVVRSLYVAAVWLASAPKGGFRRFLAEYRERGMDFYHDVHDWLGGYPYETAVSQDVETALSAMGFTRERLFENSTRGILSVGCDEYVYRRRTS